jgi:hypothetical protein
MDEGSIMVTSRRLPGICDNYCLAVRQKNKARWNDSERAWQMQQAMRFAFSSSILTHCVRYTKNSVPRMKKGQLKTQDRFS